MEIAAALVPKVSARMILTFPISLSLRLFSDKVVLN